MGTQQVSVSPTLVFRLQGGDACCLLCSHSACARQVDRPQKQEWPSLEMCSVDAVCGARRVGTKCLVRLKCEPRSRGIRESEEAGENATGFYWSRGGQALDTLSGGHLEHGHGSLSTRWRGSAFKSQS